MESGPSHRWTRRGGGLGGFKRRDGRQTSTDYNLSQRVDGRAVDGPFGDAELPQVGTGMAGEAFAVLEKLSAEFAAHVFRWLWWTREEK